MDEFAFEVELCAHLDGNRNAIVARQLGGGVTTANRVLDIVLVEPGPAFDQRASLTPHTIPDGLLDSAIGPGRFRDWRRHLGSGMAAERAVERGREIGYLETAREGGRELVRAVDRYPKDWFGRIVAIENKPDLDAPGGLYEQLQFDVTLGLVDAVVLATASHVTRAHRNRLPDRVGLWRFDPAVGELEVLRRARPLPDGEPGLEVTERHVGRVDVEPVGTDELTSARRRLAERAYGKGWRTYRLPACGAIDPDEQGVPRCSHFGHPVNPATDCTEACSGHAPAPPPAVDLDAIRDRHSAWCAETPTRRSRQGTLDEPW